MIVRMSGMKSNKASAPPAICRMPWKSIGGRLKRVSSHHFHRAFRQRVEKRLAVLLGEHAIVEHDNDAGVGFGADQSSDALAKFQDGFGQGKFAEGISAAGFNRLHARLDKRMIRH